MHEVGQVGFEIARLWVHFRVGGHFQVEVVSGFLADELDQVAGVAQFATGHAHARWQVATQGDDALDAGSLVFRQQGAQVVLESPTHDRCGAAGTFTSLSSCSTVFSVRSRVEPPAP